MEDNVKSFLDKIQELKEKTVKVYANSLKKDIDSVGLSFKQQKDLIGTIGDGPSGALKFQKTINNIISENTNNTDLLVTDKLSIIVKLRMESIGNVIKRDDGDVNLDPILKSLVKISTIKPKTIKGVVEVELHIPKLTDETKVIQAALDTLKKDESDIGKTIGNIYTYEIVKYIKSVKFGEDTILFSDLFIKDRYKVVDNLPLSINKKITEFIQDLKNKESQALEYDVNGETKVLEIDVSFFDS